ncbi:MAG: sigma-70 family RNA polymerase sigma factor [Dethiobacter sp.]|jgi:RNA polymerase sporulation-specific sigma factor|nr:MAG: sigma-70 family RNA polymerase sigma factor [Dethiobacter sp.]
MAEFTEKELQELYLKNRQGDLQAREKVINYNLPLVHAICKRFYPMETAVDYDDLFQEGCIGLLMALSKYDPGKGTKFSTYAVPFILGEIRSCLRRNGHLLKVSRSNHEHYCRLLKSKEELVQELKRQPRLEELAEKMGLPGEEIIWLMELQNPVGSLQEINETPPREEENSAFNTDKFFDSLIIQEKLNNLPPREKQIIVLRYILEKSQEEVAQILGLSQSHISRLERQAIKNLKENE